MEGQMKTTVSKQRDFFCGICQRHTITKTPSRCTEKPTSKKMGGILKAPAPSKFLPAGHHEIFFSVSVNSLKPGNDSRFGRKKAKIPFSRKTIERSRISFRLTSGRSTQAFSSVVEASRPPPPL
jgi:hypothetical protein